MLSIINFFLAKSKLTYFILVFLAISGVYFANKITKEMFPPINVDKVLIVGGYSVASIDSLNKIAVQKIEDEIKNIDGVKKIESFISSGQFQILATMKTNADKDDILAKIKDVISSQKSNYPSNMAEPSASLLTFGFPLLEISMSSSNKNKEELKKIAKILKKDFLKINNVSKVSIYDDSDYVYKFIFNHKKIEVFGLKKQSVISSIQSLSFISPIGSIQNSKQSFFISTQNGKDDVKKILNTLISVNGKYVYIKDIADVKYEAKDASILTFANKKTNVVLSISRDKVGNSISIQKDILTLMDTLSQKYKDIEFLKLRDTTTFLINRLNVVLSSLIFGILLVGVLVWVMVNFRTALLVSIGVPFSFLLGVMFLYFSGFSINMMTLLGALIILGVIVDDAIIVGENIQRHLNMGVEKNLAIKNALKEVLAPVTVACFTTIFAFMPLLLISGEMGEFMKLIPAVIIVLILASLVESFFFLPSHSKHILKQNAKELDWSRALGVYEKVLNVVIKHKKKFLMGFYILIPLATIILFSILKYTLFPQFDGNNVYVRGSFDINYTIEDTLKGMKKIENIIHKSSQKLSIKNVTSSAGFRLTSRGKSEIKPNVFDITIELYSPKPKNVFEQYITPLMAIYDNHTINTREISTNKAVSLVKNELEKIQKELNLSELIVKTDGAGVVEHSIEMQFYGNDKEKIKIAINMIKQQIADINGTTSVDDNLKIGLIDLKLYINKYGESIGITERYLATSLKSFFNKGEFSQSLNKDGVISITSQDKNKDDLNTLKSFRISLPFTNKFVTLNDVVDFVYSSNYKEMYKINSKEVSYLFADINSDFITSQEVLKQIEPLIQEIKDNGIQIKMGGEMEQNEQLKSEMTQSFAFAMFLIFSILLLMFNSYKYALIVLSVIPLSIFGALGGHFIMDEKLSVSSFIGIIGLSGVVINDAIVMLAFLKNAKNINDLIQRAKLRLRPVLITSITTFMGLSMLIFFATGQAKILQPIAVSLGFGMLWGTALTLLYVPIMTAILHHFRSDKDNVNIIQNLKKYLQGKFLRG